MQRSLYEWLCHWGALHPKVMDLGLERITRLADRLGVRKFKCPVITVGGTNGKGSTVNFLSSIYHKAGYRVGAYTSPHLLRFNERMCVNGEPISDTALCYIFQAIENIRDQVSLTYFEAATLAAFYYFQQVSLDIIILEVGLGGRLDAVNCVDADLAIITTISLDHTEILGKNRANIALEKAGILRPGKPAICGDLNPPDVLLQVAENLGVPLWLLGREFNYQETKQDWSWKHGDTVYSLSKPHLPVQNAATALAAITRLQERIMVSQQHIEQGIKDATMAGRFQMIQHEPQVLVDVAHNPESGKYLANKLENQTCTGKTYAVVGMLNDKDQENTVSHLLDIVDAWLIAPLLVIRGSDGSVLMRFLTNKGVRVSRYSSVREAYITALKQATTHDRIIVFGSFHTVSEVLT